jgi:hypothetical protein
MHICCPVLQLEAMQLCLDAVPDAQPYMPGWAVGALVPIIGALVSSHRFHVSRPDLVCMYYVLHTGVGLLHVVVA